MSAAATRTIFVEAHGLRFEVLEAGAGVRVQQDAPDAVNASLRAFLTAAPPASPP